MKELSIEQKAQRYDKALERAREEYKNHKAFKALCEMLVYIFPELKESEDEKIRKELIKGISKTRPNTPLLDTNITREDAIVWLEKQGVQKSIWHNEDEEPKKDSLILLIMQSGNPIVAKIIEPNHTFNHGERWAYIDDLLEKQGEKPQGKSALEAIKEEKVDNQNRVKPTDKVEPKFHEGDWIVYNDNGSICQIKSIKDNKYCLCPLDSDIKGYLEIINVDNEYHLWDITKDAKDGDLLVDKYNNIGIFKACEGMCWHSYIYLGCNNELYGFDIGGIHEQTNAHPATKEQRYTLERAINNAGYIWYAGKKKLKKIMFPHFKIGDTIAKKRNSNIRDFGLFTITDVTDDKYLYNGRIICDITEQDDWELL